MIELLQYSLSQRMKSVLEGYKIVKYLGKGAYGTVNLVQDEEGHKFAVKEIQKSLIEKYDVLQYLQGQIKCMLQLDSPYIVKLYKHLQDETKHYLICEFCNLGTLMSYQIKQPNHVFSLEQGIKIIVDIANGLEVVHRHGYMHRDLKLENILVHRENDQLFFKLADFGFSKKVQESQNTVLGTGPYMGPQIYSLNQKYDEQIDMWALAVTFYFMLNACFPFQPPKNPHASLKDQRVQLMRQVKNFNYQKSVKSSRKKILGNCVPDVINFFEKAFQINPEDRITFYSLRLHPLFQEYFPKIPSDVKRLGSTKVSRKNSETKQKFEKENIFATLKFCNVLNLSQFMDQIKKNGQQISELSLLALEYNVEKFKLMHLNQFRSEQEIRKWFQSQNFKGNWEQFMQTQEIQELMIDFFNQINRSEIELLKLYDKCRPVQIQIKKKNPNFARFLTKDVREFKISKQFRESYMTSTGIVYKEMLKDLKKTKKRSVLIAITMVSILHFYPVLLEADPQSLEQAFPDFFKDSKNDPKLFNFTSLREWIWQASNNNLKNTIKATIKAFQRT